MTAFDSQPTLTDGAIHLRPMRAEDWAGLYAIASDPELWALHPAANRWQEPVFRDFFDAGLASGGALVIEDTLTGAVIGSSRYDRSRAEAGEIEIGWTFLARSYWGGTTNAAVKRLMLAHALATFDRAIFSVGEGNIRSRRALENIGAALTSRQRDVMIEGRAINHVLYAIDRTAFANGPLTR